MRTSLFAGLSVATALTLAAETPSLILSHSWIVVTTGAPERKALENAGFRIVPTVNRHDGQGTASVTVEFLNGFLELIYPDSTVPISRAQQAGAEKFRLNVGVARDGLFSNRHRLRSLTSNAGQAPLPNVESLCRLDGEEYVH